jgi:hypothetical protein
MRILPDNEVLPLVAGATFDLAMIGPVLSTAAANILTPGFHRAHVRFNCSEFGVICDRRFPVFAFAE